MSTNRMKPEEILKEAKDYFEKLGLTGYVDAFFATDLVKEVIHTTYEKYEGQVKNLVQNMPKEIRKRGEALLPEAIGREEAYSSDVKSNLVCNIVRVIKVLEDFVPVDETISNLFIKSFVDEADGKMLEMVKYFAEGLADSLLKDFMMAVSVPVGLPPEVAGLVAMLGGKGSIAMDGNEFLEFLENMMEENPDEDDYEEGNNCC